MTIQKKNSTNYQTLSQPQTIFITNDGQQQAFGIGSISMPLNIGKTISIDNVIHVLSLVKYIYIC
jgi:hypothetical protein